MAKTKWQYEEKIGDRRVYAIHLLYLLAGVIYIIADKLVPGMPLARARSKRSASIFGLRFRVTVIASSLVVV